MKLNKLKTSRVILFVMLGIILVGLVLNLLLPNNQFPQLFNNDQQSNDTNTDNNFLDSNEPPENISISSLERSPSTTLIPRITGIAENSTTQTLLENNSYAILKTDSEYSIVILNTPTDIIQEEAERALVDLLDLPSNELCKLSIQVSIPRYVTGTAKTSEFQYCNQ